MVTFINTILSIGVIITTIFIARRPQKDNVFYIMLGVIVILTLLIWIVGYIGEAVKQGNIKKDITAGILNDFKNNCEVLHTWKTCLNKMWTPTRHVRTTLDRYQLIHSLGDRILETNIANTYGRLEEAEARIERFREVEGFENEQELDAMKRFLNSCMEDVKGSIELLTPSIQRDSIADEYKKGINLPDSVVIDLYMDYNEHAASGDQAQVYRLPSSDSGVTNKHTEDFKGLIPKTNGE